MPFSTNISVFDKPSVTFPTVTNGYWISRVVLPPQSTMPPGWMIELKLVSSHALVQFVTLYRGGEKAQMSTRSGEFITLRELRNEVGNDACRFFYVMRGNDQHLDFDLELAKSRSNDNPVYYIQYAHARVASVLKQLESKGYAYDGALGLANLALLNSMHEAAVLTALDRYPEIIALAGANRAPHTLVHYLRELANTFHTYYNAEQFIVEDAALRNARLSLVLAVQQVVRNGLGLLGVSAPDTM